MADDKPKITDSIASALRAIPGKLPLVATDDAWALPDSIIPFQTGDLSLIRCLNEVAGREGLVVITNDPDEFDAAIPNEAKGKLAVAARVMRVIHLPDGGLRVVTHGVRVVRIERVTVDDRVPYASLKPLAIDADASLETQATARSVTELFTSYVARHPTLPDELRVAAANVPSTSALAAMVAIHSNFPREERPSFLAELSLRKRLERLLAHLRKELDIMKLSNQIQQRVMSDLEGRNREIFLREQMRQIQSELNKGAPAGEEGDDELEALKKRVAAALLPKEAADEAQRELRRLDRMHPSSAEYGVVRGYLDWMLELPWGKFSEDRIDLRASKKQLDGDHFALQRVKERILEFLAVRKLNPEKGGQILCLAGPPGVGKTSLGRSIATAMNREFVRMSVGGVHDEGEIRGHRRTYVGAMPGKILQLLRRCKTSNPVFLIDEIDKLGQDFRGDPASALLEVLDPEQNSGFVDHYLNVPFDLSRVFFIATANRTDTIPPALRDRLEIIEINGYTREEKAQIAVRHLVPRAAKDHGLAAAQLKVPLPVLRFVVDEYTREAGVRALEKRIHALARKIARGVAESRESPRAKKAKGKSTSKPKGAKPVVVSKTRAREMLGPAPFSIDEADRPPVPGLAVGLAWTPTGGDILYVEAAAFASDKADGKLILTGQMGDVMREACEAGYTYLRSHANEYGIPPEAFAGKTFHLHIPAGAIPKDGPSAGITTTVALYSLLTGKKPKAKTAMTGEITSHGTVLPIGGLTEKVLAARRAGIKRVLLPGRNEKDLSEVPEEGKQGITFLPVSSFDDVVGACF